MFTYPNSEPVTPTDSLPVVGLLLFPLLLVGIFAALSYPLYALGAVGAVVVARRSGRALAARLARDADRVREFPLPGVGTVRFTVEPR
ncbi:hypothetical protein BRD14_06350 [Halobacteriales archaeon SW_5_68_122]|nr:MAG: hypothetical protein BRD14_06350 [Halobacteriales archaeon SW_5_68_122]